MTQSQEFLNSSEILQEGLLRLGLTANETQLAQLQKYAELLLKWNKTYNLTSIRNKNEVFTHHLLDSASLIPVLRKQTFSFNHVLDVGSGGGLPSIPMAIFCPELKISAIDAVSKKTAFLTQVGIELGLKNFHAIHTRIETLKNIEIDCITSRAFSSLVDFVTLTKQLANQKTVWIAMKGVLPSKEIEDIPEDIQLLRVEEINVPYLQEQRHFVLMKKKNVVFL